MRFMRAKGNGSSRKAVAFFFMTVLMSMLLTQSVLAAQAFETGDEEHQTIRDSSDSRWKKIQTDVITIMFPSGGKKPMFLWWYNKDNSNIYVVKFDGLTEYFTFSSPFYNHTLQADNSTFQKLYDDEVEQDEIGQGRHMFNIIPRLFDRTRLGELREIMKDITHAWGHPTYLPFSGCRWDLQNVANITADDETTIGLTFTFNLTEALPRFKFAENNIAIRVRFYYVPVEENVGDLYSYSVGANEMKMDFIVKDWRWNLDLVQPLLQRLTARGINVPQTSSGLALGIHLASLNATGYRSVKTSNGDDNLDSSATTHSMFVENRRVTFLKGRDDENEIALDVAKKLDEQYKLKFATANDTLGGFFKFVASAMVENSTGSYKVPVKASYAARGATLRVFIGYPYFNGTLSHDPSIGVETPETTTSSANTPSYRVLIGDTAAATPTANLIAPQLLSMQVVMVLVAVTTAIALILVASRSRGRRLILRSV